MSTHANIIAQLSDGTTGSIYLGFDGYPEHALNILLEHYSDQNAIEELIALGDLSSLDTEIATCEAYHRDRGEDWDDVCPVTIFTNECIDPKEFKQQEYAYYWNGKFWKIL